MNTIRESNRLWIITLSGLLMSAPQAALPEEGGHRRELTELSSTIDATDVDLSTPSGARWAYRRIISKAKAICWQIERNNGVRSYSIQVEQAYRCFDEAVSGTLARVAEATGIDIKQTTELDRYDEAGVLASR